MAWAGASQHSYSSRAWIRPSLGSITPDTGERVEISKLGLNSLSICSKVSAKKEKISKVGCDMEVYGSKFMFSVQRLKWDRVTAELLVRLWTGVILLRSLPGPGPPWFLTRESGWDRSMYPVEEVFFSLLRLECHLFSACGWQKRCSQLHECERSSN